MRHVVTIRDVSLLSMLVSCMGTPDLRDAALEAAPDAAPPDATKEEVARVAASLIVVGAGGDPAKHGLPVLTEEQLRRAEDARQAMARATGPTAGEEYAALQLAQAERYIGTLEGQLSAEREAHAATSSDLTAAREQCDAFEAALDEAGDRIKALGAEGDELRAKLAQCEAAVRDLSEQIEPTQAPAPAETSSKKK